MKTIEQVFTIEVGKKNLFHITARNYNQPIFSAHFSTSHFAQGCLSISEIRELGEWLVKTANDIKNDKDFTQSA